MHTLIIAVFVSALLSWQAQAPNDLTDTRWTGIVNAPNPATGLLEFKKDSMQVYINSDVIEVMSYETKGDTLVIKKLSGASPCDGEPASYTYRVKDNVLTVTPVRDNCDARVHAFAPEGYKKQVKVN